MLSKRGRKAQLTAFIILGMLVLLIFLFLYSVSSQDSAQSSQRQAVRAAERIAEMPALDLYVTQCVRTALVDGLTLIGRQGGRIFQSQGGSIPEPETGDFVDFNNYKVSYAITSISREFDNPNFPPPPRYPCFDSPNGESYTCPYDDILTLNADEIETSEQFIFGRKNLSFLCQPGGPNQVPLNQYPYPCPVGTYGPDSIQEQLQRFIALRLRSQCSDFSQVEQISNLQVTAGIPSVKVIIGESEVIAAADYPLNFAIPGKERAELVEFEAKIPVRLKKIIGLADYLVFMDRSYVDFKIDDPETFKKSDYYDTGLSVAKIACPDSDADGNSVCQSNLAENPNPDYSSIIEVKDLVSNIDGNPYRFWFAIENRPPVLEKIEQPYGTPTNCADYSDADTCNTNSCAWEEGISKCRNYDFKTEVATPISLSLKMYDPDNDMTNPAIPNYRAFRQQNLNPAEPSDFCGCAADFVTQASAQELCYQLTPTIGENADPDSILSSSSDLSIPFISDFICPDDCDNADPDNECTYGESGLGVHTTRVITCDAEGEASFDTFFDSSTGQSLGSQPTYPFCDWQDVKILVTAS